MDSVITENTFLNSPNPSIPVPISSVKPSSLRFPSLKASSVKYQSVSPPSVKPPSVKPPSVKPSSVKPPSVSAPSVKLSSAKNSAMDKAFAISTKLSSVKDSIEKESSGLDFFTILRYIFIILIIIFLGFNLFTYLGGNPILGGIFNRDEENSNIDKPKLTRKQINKGGINKLNKALNKKTELRNKVDDDSNSAGRALKQPTVDDEGPLPDESDSKTQRGSFKPGFCYVGEDRGIRSCVKVNESDMCMSGDIFPTNAICVNPSLRE